MKQTKIMRKVVAGFFAIFSTAVMASTPITVPAPIEGVFVPKGFDSNDQSQIIVKGYLPNLCHKSPGHKILITGNKIDVKVTALKYEPSNTFCPEMIVPFTETVSLGVLDKGQYEITVNGLTIYEKKSSITVMESTSSAVDDYVYASVENIIKLENSREILLEGYNPSDCFELDEIKYVSNGKDTFSILPIMKQVHDLCPMKMVKFSYRWEVPKSLQAENVLLHVRVMDGKSVNTIFPNYINGL